MEINEYKVINEELIKLPIGRSQVNSNGDETIGVSMFVSDYDLEQLIRGTLFINGNDQGEHLRWFSRNSLSSESNWNDLFSTLRGYGSWN